MKKLLWMLALVYGALVNTVAAEPVNAVSAGKTYIYLSDAAVEALEVNSVEYAALWPASFNAGKQRFKFRIAGGVVDSNGYIGELIHLGGLRLAVTELELGLHNFIIDNNGDAPIITAVVSINGEVGVLWPPEVAAPLDGEPLDEPTQEKRTRIAIFSVTPGEADSKNDRKATVVGSALTPHPELLELLGSIGVILSPDDEVGTANLQLVLKPNKHSSDDDDGVEEASGDDHPGKGKEKSEEAKSKDKGDGDEEEDEEEVEDE